MTQTVTVTTAQPSIIEHFVEQLPTDATFDPTQTTVVPADPAVTLTCKPFSFITNDDLSHPADNDSTTDVGLYSVTFKADASGTTTHTFTVDADRVVVESAHKRPFTGAASSAAYLWCSKGSLRFPGDVR